MPEIEGVPKQSDFFQNVYEVVELIPFGKVTSYGAIAKYLGAARSSRVVGWAMNGSLKNNLNLPAHRVVNRNGQLTGKIHFSSPSEMQMRLEKEGVKVKNDTILHFESHFWDPSKELL